MIVCLEQRFLGRWAMITDRIEKQRKRAEQQYAKVQAATERYNAEVDKLRVLEDIQRIAPGDTVRFVSGKVGFVDAIVQGVRSSQSGLAIKVLVGTGFDARTITISDRDVVAVYKQEKSDVVSN